MYKVNMHITHSSCLDGNFLFEILSKTHISRGRSILYSTRLRCDCGMFFIHNVDINISEWSEYLWIYPPHFLSTPPHLGQLCLLLVVATCTIGYSTICSCFHFLLFMCYYLFLLFATISSMYT